MFLSDSDFIKFALQKYDNPKIISVKEFEADIKRFTHINNLFNRYRQDKFDLKDRLIINHIVILGNCFTVPGSLKMLDYKIPEINKFILNTFLSHMGLIEIDSVDNYLLSILEAT